MHSQPKRVSGHVFRKTRKKGPVWYAKYRLPDGRQVQLALGLEWKGKGRPPTGYFTKRTAEAELQAILTDARRGTLAGMVKTDVTFADAAEEWYRHGEQGGGKRPPWKPSTRRDYRSALDLHLIPAFGAMPLEAVTKRRIEAWRSERMAAGKLPRRTANKLVMILHGIFERARDALELEHLTNPAARVERLGIEYNPEDYDFYSPEDVWALVRAADSEQDGALFLTAAFTGARMGELLALRVRDVDFEAEAIRVFGSVDIREGVGTPKSGRGRSVPMVPEVAQALARLLQRERFTGPDDFVFVGATGKHVDGSALRRRFKDARKDAKLRPIRFHDLRHTFGSLASTKGSELDVQSWMGHADSRTTARYRHYRSRGGEAKVLSEAFRVQQDNAVTTAS